MHRKNGNADVNNVNVKLRNIFRNCSAAACIDLAELWQQTAAQNELAVVKAQLAAAMAQLNSAEEVKL